MKNEMIFVQEPSQLTDLLPGFRMVIQRYRNHNLGCRYDPVKFVVYESLDEETRALYSLMGYRMFFASALGPVVRIIPEESDHEYLVVEYTEEYEQ